jgi:dienelactone hydrolase
MNSAAKINFTHRRMQIAMKKHIHALLAVGCILLALPTVLCQTKPMVPRIPGIIPVELLFNQEDKSDFRLSPDGKTLAFIEHAESSHNLVLQEVGGCTTIQLTRDSLSAFPPKSSLHKNPFYWLNDHELVFLKDKDGDGNYRVFLVETSTREPRCLTDFPNSFSSIVSVSSGKENEIVISCNKRNPSAPDLYRLNVHSGTLKMIYQNPGGMKIYFVDNAGTPRLARTPSGVSRMNTLTGELEEAFAARIDQVFLPVCFSDEGNSVYVYSNIGRDKTALVEYDLGSLQQVRVLCEDSRYDLWSLEERNDAIVPTSECVYSPAMKKLLYVSYTSEQQELCFFDEETKERFEVVRRRLGAYDYSMESYSDDYSKCIFRISSGTLKGSYYLYDHDTGKVMLIHQLSMWLPQRYLADVKPVSFTSRDGQTLHGYLTIPKGADMKNMSVLVNVHGGPHLRDTPGYNDINQLFANRRYLVFQVNYRGSQGYGYEFMKAGYKQWGLRMQDDISDGIQWLIREGIADKSRIAIYGFSSGGYSVLAGLAFTPELYSCGISVSGNVNLFPYFRMVPGSARAMTGDPVRDSVQIVATSPLFHTEQLKSPLLIVNGAKDGSIPINEVDDFVNLLRRQGTDVVYLRYDNLGHNIIYDPKYKLEVFAKAESFLQKNIMRRP